MDDLIEHSLLLTLNEASRDALPDFGSESEGETRFHASPHLGESGEEQAEAEDDSFPSLNELRESIVGTLDASIANFDDLFSRRGVVSQPQLFKLTDDLLGIILGILVEPQLAEPPSTICYQKYAKRSRRNEEFKESVKTIQRLRLVCRRICNVSSPFLIPIVRVELNTQSLARLDMISRHSTIGKGVRTVRVITRCLDRVLANSFENFRRLKSRYLRQSLEDLMNTKLSVDEEGESRMSWELYRRYISAGSYNSILMGILYYGFHVSDGSDDSNVHQILRQIFWSKAFERYKHLLAEQENLTKENVFLEGVSTAVARMPRATTLQVYDKDRDNLYEHRPHLSFFSKSKLLIGFCENEDKLIDDINKSKLLGCGDYDDSNFRIDKSWSSPSAQILLKLPAAIHKAGRLLENICIEIKGPRDYRTLASFEGFQALSAATQRLKQFTFYNQYGFDDESDEEDEWTPKKLDGLITYLSAIVNTNALEKIDINLCYLGIGMGNLDMEKPNPSVPSLGTILTSRIWPNLKSVYLNGITPCVSHKWLVERGTRNIQKKFDPKFDPWGANFKVGVPSIILQRKAFLGLGQEAILLGLWRFAGGQ
ncbi:hypothetical protein BPOR_0942g00040 [Botrytis porri]|uniref:Uncharacterized protein n=1 Tax=Botrytis porri TaxID=87229 RepID=A0A4Z1K970_9HELO|nr:hypothetical protein BPOR_0942g00040 [Botrytis porri]